MKRLIFLFIFSLFRIIVHFHHGKAAYLVADHASFEVKKNWFKSSIFNCMTLKKKLKYLKILKYLKKIGEKTSHL